MYAVINTSTSTIGSSRGTTELQMLWTYLGVGFVLVILTLSWFSCKCLANEDHMHFQIFKNCELVFSNSVLFNYFEGLCSRYCTGQCCRDLDVTMQIIIHVF